MRLECFLKAKQMQGLDQRHTAEEINFLRSTEGKTKINRRKGPLK
jgi:hypothetical protein